MRGTYELSLVLLSLVVATGASYTALLLGGRLTDAGAQFRPVWLAGGGIAMGTGIWSMHFIGMLAFRLPIPMGFDLALTLLSWALAVAASALALGLTGRAQLSAWRGLAGAVVIGGGISAMHYVGMAALRMTPDIIYSPVLVAGSIAIAIGASAAALILLRRHDQARRAALPPTPLAAALLMGIAITGMHYTAMAAAEFPTGAICGALGSLSNDGLLSTVLVGVLAVLGFCATIARLDARAQLRARAHARSLARAQVKLYRAAASDPLTGLPNRHRLERRLHMAVARARNNGGRVGLLALDLDGFKAINDGLGHAVGDELLRRIAIDLTECRSPGMTLARLGGDEFALLCPSLADVTAAVILGDRIGALVHRARSIDGHEIRISASIGIALLPDHAAGAEDLLVRADTAMHAAKRANRNRCCVFEPSMDLTTGEMLRLRAELARAIECDELELFLQPKVAAGDASPTGAEALLRWRNPRRGLLGPGVFLPIAERFGLMNEIGDWVIDAGCALAARLACAGQSCRIAINLSPEQFQQADLATRIDAAMRRHGIDGRQLMLEITESSAIENASGVGGVLAALRALGLDVALDDFGTGYSSLSYLRLLRAQQLKLDRSFILDIEESAESRIIVGAIIQLAHAIGMRTVAEGVESAAQAALLDLLGCDELQGFLFSPALCEGEFIAWLAAHRPRAPLTRLPKQSTLPLHSVALHGIPPHAIAALRAAPAPVVVVQTAP